MLKKYLREVNQDLIVAIQEPMFWVAFAACVSAGFILAILNMKGY